MKTKLCKLIVLSVVSLMLAGMIISCKEKEQSIEISCTEYVLIEETSCQWPILNYDKSVVAVNSYEEMACSDSSTNPAIDFSTHTLLLTSGSSGDIREFDIKFFKNSVNKYTLKITIHLGIATVVRNWSKSILVPKISDDATIILEQQETYY